MYPLYCKLLFEQGKHNTFVPIQSKVCKLLKSAQKKDNVKLIPIILLGGWCCYNKETCDSRYKSIPRLMSSADWPQTRKGRLILTRLTATHLAFF